MSGRIQRRKPAPTAREQAYMEELGLRIRRRRRALDLTQKELVNKIGFSSASYLCEIEKGRKAVNSFLLFLIEKEIGSIWISGSPK